MRIIVLGISGFILALHTILFTACVDQGQATENRRTPFHESTSPSQPIPPNNPPVSPISPTNQPADPSTKPALLPIDLSQLPHIELHVPGNANFKITNYGATLQGNKQTLMNAIQGVGASSQEAALILAIAMQETVYMSESERDGSKDQTPSANISFLNVNYDMLTKLGYARQDFGSSLNDSPQLNTVVGYLVQAFRAWGIERTLNYQRGGSTAFNDGVSYGAATYRNAIQTIYQQIARDPALATDGRRVEIDVPHV